MNLAFAFAFALPCIAGVSSVVTNVDEKSVIITAEEGVTVTAEEMVEKLAKWSAASGKYVKIP